MKLNIAILSLVLQAFASPNTKPYIEPPQVDPPQIEPPQVDPPQTVCSHGNPIVNGGIIVDVPNAFEGGVQKCWQPIGNRKIRRAHHHLRRSNQEEEDDKSGPKGPLVKYISCEAAIKMNEDALVRKQCEEDPTAEVCSTDDNGDLRKRGAVAGLVGGLPIVGPIAGGVVGTVTGVVGGLPLVGPLVGGIVKRDEDVEKRGLVSGLVGGLPLVGPVAGGVVGTVTGVAGGLPLVGPLVGGIVKRDVEKRGAVAGIVGGLPIVGPVVGGVVDTVTGVAGGLPVVGPILGGIVKRDVEKRGAVAGLVGGLPIVGPIAGGVVGTVTGVVGGLPLVGPLVGGIVKRDDGPVTILPIVPPVCDEALLAQYAEDPGFVHRLQVEVLRLSNTFDLFQQAFREKLAEAECNHPDSPAQPYADEPQVDRRDLIGKINAPINPNVGDGSIDAQALFSKIVKTFETVKDVLDGAFNKINDNSNLNRRHDVIEECLPSQILNFQVLLERMIQSTKTVDLDLFCKITSQKNELVERGFNALPVLGSKGHHDKRQVDMVSALLSMILTGVPLLGDVTGGTGGLPLVGGLLNRRSAVDTNTLFSTTLKLLGKEGLLSHNILSSSTTSAGKRALAFDASKFGHALVKDQPDEAVTLAPGESTAPPEAMTTAVEEMTTTVGEMTTAVVEPTSAADEQTSTSNATTTPPARRRTRQLGQMNGH